jgi:hypothetical protein
MTATVLLETASDRMDIAYAMEFIMKLYRV